MAVTQLNDQGIGTTDFTKLVNATDKNAKGINQISLSAYDTDAAPDVKVGSVFENNGATFIVDSADITPTGYAGISNSTTFYLYYDETGTTFIFSSTAPTWNDALQGYYNGNDRAFFSMYKDSGGTLYQLKEKLTRIQNLTVNNELVIGGQIKPKYFHSASSTTLGAVFDILDPWVPTTNKYMHVAGQMYSGTRYSIHRIYRTNSTTISLALNNGSTAWVNVTITSADGTGVTDISIMSFFDAIG